MSALLSGALWLEPGMEISFLTSLWRASTQTGDFVQTC